MSAGVEMVLAAVVALLVVWLWYRAHCGQVICCRCGRTVRVKFGLPRNVPSGGLCGRCFVAEQERVAQFLEREGVDLRPDGRRARG